MKKYWYLLALFFSITTCFAIEPLPLDKAFVFSTQLSANNNVVLHWDIAAKHYLYRNHFQFKIIQPSNAKIAPVTMPPAELKQDQILGKYEVYKNQVTIPLTINNPGTGNVILDVHYQGCSEDGYCYPPTMHQVTANFSTKTINTDATATTTAEEQQEPTGIKGLLASQHYYLMMLGFFIFGLLLSFTPCVLPMIPILSGMIVGQGHHMKTGKAFRLSLVYVLSMSLTYALAGILIGYLGGTAQAIMQKPWVIILFSLVFVLMALSMFGLYNLEPPKKLEALLARVSAHQAKGHYIGVAVMGCLGTLIVSPCVTPALVAALGYVTQSGDYLLGGSALFATGLGMGVPLLLIGTSTRLLPKAGHWMVTVKSILGILLLGVAIFMLSRVFSAIVTMSLWAALFIGSAIYLGIFNNGVNTKWSKLKKFFALLLLMYGTVLAIGVFMGNTNPLKPLERMQPHTTLSFQPINSVEDLQHALALAKSANKPVMLDFYADWCVACKSMDKNTFSNPDVKEALSHFMLLRADVTANSATNKILLTQYGVIAPPTMLFFTPDGKNNVNARIVGELGPEDFLQHLQKITP
jgi:thiol:disulfide interchange protein DsbD